ncbi:hypothetical protein QYF61_005304 [Mycteria americana]|uniref:Uncharacterized protein n=1 Tax=Mycteria americana TaxID=33587 RepID=A0AAN7MUB0_MYCAM|nr:hypothetical protein QYF61_005304 [Mycteria americana]
MERRKLRSPWVIAGELERNLFVYRDGGTKASPGDGQAAPEWVFDLMLCTDSHTFLPCQGKPGGLGTSSNSLIPIHELICRLESQGVISKTAHPLTVPYGQCESLMESGDQQ